MTIFSATYSLLAFLNSAVAEYLLVAMNPTLNTQVADVLALPFPPAGIDRGEIGDREENAVKLSSADWDNFETSWDFRDHPLLRPGLKGATLEATWQNWESQSSAAIHRMQELESENNRRFITFSSYGLRERVGASIHACWFPACGASPEDQITLGPRGPNVGAMKDQSRFAPPCHLVAATEIDYYG